MLTKDDKGWITDNFVTRGEFRSEIKEVKDGISRMEGKIDKIITIADGFSGKVADLDQENKMGAVALRRHDVQIHELATATGTAISE